jgi:hypothetical protein
VGQEIDCTLRYQRKIVTGKAHLETDFLLFRGDERLKVPFRDLKSVKADGGTLKLDFPGGPAVLELGAAAEKWARKILHPPSRLDKLGVKAGLSVRVTGGDFEAGFLDELRARNVEWIAPASKVKTDLVFFAAEAVSDLGGIPKLAGAMKPDGGLWVVHPKGVAVISEMDVIEGGRAAGLKDVKVARFSATHTARKFVIPLTDR